MDEKHERDFFQNRFDKFESEPDERVWNRIRTGIRPPRGSLGRLYVAGMVLAGGLAAGVAVVWALHTAAIAPGRTPHAAARPPATPPGAAGAPGRTPAPAAPGSPRTKEAKDAAGTKEISAEKQPPADASAPAMPRPGGPPSATAPRKARPAAPPVPEAAPPGTETPVRETPGRGADMRRPGRQKSTARPAEPGQPSGNTARTPPGESRIPTEANPILPAESRIAPAARRTGLSGGPAAFGLLSARPLRLKSGPAPAGKTISFKPLPVPAPDIRPRPQKTPAGWQIHGGITHWMNYQHVMPVLTDSLFVDNVRLGPVLASQRSGWQGQVGAARQVGSRIRVRLGAVYAIQHTAYSYQSRRLHPVVSVAAVQSGGILVRRDYHPQTHVVDQRQQSFGLRLDGQYLLGRLLGLEHYVSAGVQGLYAHTPADTSLQADGQLGYGLVRPLGGRLSVWLEPSFRYRLASRADARGLVRLRPYAFGMQAGLSWRLMR